MLTPRQRQLLEFLTEYAQAHPGSGPTWDEMRIALRAKSKSSISRLVGALIKRGYVRHDYKSIRGIEIVDRDALRAASDEALLLEMRRRGLKG